MTEKEKKQCTKCKEEKPIDDFYLLEKGGTRRKARCKACESTYEKERYATPDGKTAFLNRPSSRKRWGNYMINQLGIKPNEY